jgi:hypothetical protein
MFQRYVVSVARDVAKIDQNVTYVAIATYGCCKRLFEMFHLFKVHVASVLSECCICFMLDVAVFVSNILSDSVVCCNKFFFGVASVFMFQTLNGTAKSHAAPVRGPRRLDE